MYHNHVDALEEQLEREPKSFPNLQCAQNEHHGYSGSYLFHFCCGRLRASPQYFHKDENIIVLYFCRCLSSDLFSYLRIHVLTVENSDSARLCRR
jgi:hypothetical protein